MLDNGNKQVKILAQFRVASINEGTAYASGKKSSINVEDIFFQVLACPCPGLS